MFTILFSIIVFTGRGASVSTTKIGHYPSVKSCQDTAKGIVIAANPLPTDGSIKVTAQCVYI